MADSIVTYNNQAMASSSNALKLANLSPENIKSGVSVAGIVGNYTGDNPPYMNAKVRGSGGYATTLTINDVGFEAKEVMFIIEGTNITNYKVLCGYYKKNTAGGVAWQYRPSGAALVLQDYIRLEQNGTTLTIKLQNSNYYFDNYNNYNVFIFG